MRIIIDGGHRDADRIYSVQQSDSLFVKQGFPYVDELGNYNSSLLAGDCTHSYNRDTGKFFVPSEGTPEWGRTFIPNILQAGGSAFDVHFETANIMFMREAGNDAALTLFLKTAASMCGMDVSYASDGNYVFASSTNKDTGERIETANWNNDDLYYKGSRRFVIKRVELQERNASCVRFKVECATSTIDDFSILAVEMHSAGMIFSEWDGE